MFFYRNETFCDEKNFTRYKLLPNYTKEIFAFQSYVKMYVVRVYMHEWWFVTSYNLSL